MKNLPRWELSSVYPAFESPQFQTGLEELAKLKEEIVKLGKNLPKQAGEEPVWIRHYLEFFNRFQDLFDNLYAFAYMRFSTDTADFSAVNAMNLLDEIRIPVQSSLVWFRNKLANLTSSIASCMAAEPELRQYSFFIGEQLFLRSRQMSQEEEELAMDLLRTGGDLWSRLQETVTSALSAVWDAKRKIVKTVTELRSLASDPKREKRKKAFLLEKRLWESVKTPLAFSINGVKGFTVILARRRRYQDCVERSLVRARVSRPALEALVSAMKDSLPDFRRYFRAKAARLKLPRLAFYDLFAPLPGKQKKWSFVEARAFILKQFALFSDELAAFGRRAFDNGWIDAAPRKGKVGGAYCISLPVTRESRVLCNFSETFGAVTTIAHELGHAWHHHVLRDLSAIHRDYPMTLAETASIFAENLIFEGALKTFPKTEKAAALEHFLQDAGQIIVDILSRYLFESRLCEARTTRELSADELCGLMTDVQKETYGDALDPKSLHPYMWAVKSHYYRPELPFYNYPYAYGLLFGLGLFARFREEGKRFAATYKKMLEKTGCMTCADLAKDLGFDIEKRDFWESGLGLIRTRIDEFEMIAAPKRNKS